MQGSWFEERNNATLLHITCMNDSGFVELQQRKLVML